MKSQRSDRKDRIKEAQQKQRHDFNKQHVVTERISDILAETGPGLRVEAGHHLSALEPVYAPGTPM